jgi:hypothetical protein
MIAHSIEPANGRNRAKMNKGLFTSQNNGILGVIAMREAAGVN